MGSSVRPSVENARPYGECVWAAALTSGRAAWIWLWMANAAVFTGQSPSTTLPWWSTQDEVAGPDQPEAHAERVDPEQLGVLGVAPGQVAGDALVEAELVEQPEGGGHPLLEVGALLVGRRERGEGVGMRSGVPGAPSWSACHLGTHGASDSTGPLETSAGRSSSHRARCSASGSSSTRGLRSRTQIRPVEPCRTRASRGRRCRERRGGRWPPTRRTCGSRADGSRRRARRAAGPRRRRRGCRTRTGPR